jgi:hypothetical protein
MSIQRLYVVTDGYKEFSYWTTEKLARAALERYRKLGMVSAQAEVEVIGVNIDGFTRTKLTKER